MIHPILNLISVVQTLDITPTPDSILSVFMAYVPVENAVNIEPQEPETSERKGFTVVEWCGAVINSNTAS